MKTIFLDMDGVVADYEAMARTVLNNNEYVPPGYKYPTEQWNKIKNFDRFYKYMPVIEGSKEFVNNVLVIAGEHNYDVKFLTAVPNKNDMPYAFTDKVFWAQKYFPGIDVWFGPYSKDKHLKASVDNILVDDRTVNINDWKAAGGIGILFEGNFAETITILNKHMRV